MFITRKVETSIAIRKIYYDGIASNMEFEYETLLMEKCRSQKRNGVTQVFFSKLGRGISATREFKKNEVVTGYHWRDFTKNAKDKIAAMKGVKREFSLEVKGPDQKIINASADTCPVHLDSRRMGRLNNHSVVENNIKSTDVIVFAKNDQRYVVLRASRMFEYEELKARFEFSESQSEAAQDTPTTVPAVIKNQEKKTVTIFQKIRTRKIDDVSDLLFTDF